MPLTWIKIVNILLLYLEMEVPAMLFLGKFPRRRGWGLRLLAVFGLAFGVSWGLVVVKDAVMRQFVFPGRDSMASYLFATSFFQMLNECVTLLLVALAVWTTMEVSRMNIVFICCTAFSMQSIAESAASLSAWLRLGRYYRLQQFWGDFYEAAMYLAIFAVVYLICYYFVIRQYTFEEHVPSDRTITLCTIALLSVSLILGSAQIPEDSEQAMLLFVFILLTRMLVGILGLVMLFALTKWINLQFNYARQEYMNQLQRQQYQIAKESIDTVNINAHDLRHQISLLKEAIRQSGPSPDVEKEIEDISAAVDVVDTVFQTGNRALDITLTQKARVCREKEIQFSAMADGTAIDFMKGIDVYVLMGNALDNAIEAASLISEPEERVINLYVRKEGNGVIIHMENTYGIPPVFSSQGPLSHKNSPLHGFGTKSMRNVVNKYSGNMKMDLQDSLFMLDCYMPRMERTEQAGSR